MEARHKDCEQLIAVFTVSTYNEWIIARRISNQQTSRLSWDNTNKNLIPHSEGEPCLISFELGSYVLRIANENDSSLTQTKWIDELAHNVINSVSCAKSYVAIHSLKEYLQDKHAVEKADALTNFHHDLPDYKDFLDTLIALLKRIEKGDADLEEDCGRVKSAIESLAGQVRTNKVSALKHKIANCLLPVDIDLQGWPEADFDAEYGREIRDAYFGKSLGLVERARHQLYEGAYNLELITQESSEKIIPAKQQIIKLLPRNRFDASDKLFKDASIIVNDLETGNMDNVKRALETANPFHDWFAALMDALDKLRGDL